jgi:aspartyl protease family protein
VGRGPRTHAFRTSPRNGSASGPCARTAGINRSELLFNRITCTANDAARFAPVTLRELRIGQISIDNVPAAVIENLGQSLPGMSFLTRLKSFEIHAGTLTINW